MNRRDAAKHLPCAVDTADRIVREMVGPDGG